MEHHRDTRTHQNIVLQQNQINILHTNIHIKRRRVVRSPDTFRYNGRTKSKPRIHYALQFGVYNLFFV